MPNTLQFVMLLYIYVLIYFSLLFVSPFHRWRDRGFDLNRCTIILQGKGKGIHFTSCKPPAPFARNAKSVFSLIKANSASSSHVDIFLYLFLWGLPTALWERVFPQRGHSFLHTRGAEGGDFSLLFVTLGWCWLNCLHDVKLGMETRQSLWPPTRVLGLFWRTNIYSMCPTNC